MPTTLGPFQLHILPRQSMQWADFLIHTPRNSIALDGAVLGGPGYHEATQHINFDHHDNVVREATMSTAMQVYFAIKGGLMDAFIGDRENPPHIFINDTDQDTALAVWYLLHYKDFEGVQSNPIMSRLLALNDRWDITGGAFSMNLDNELVRKHAWVFANYGNLRKSGALAHANEHILLENLEATLGRLDKYRMGAAEECALDTRHTILYDCPAYKIVHEIGGNEARYYLYSHGMTAFVSLVATRPDGRLVYSIGRKSQFIQFPIRKLYDDLNRADGLKESEGWNGSDIVGGSSRLHGSTLSWEQIRDIVNARLKKE